MIDHDRLEQQLLSCYDKAPAEPCVRREMNSVVFVSGGPCPCLRMPMEFWRSQQLSFEAFLCLDDALIRHQLIGYHKSTLYRDG